MRYSKQLAERTAKLLLQVKAERPLVHFITNYVTVNDCANICLAIGGSPIMADAIEEACDITSIASSLVINIGTLNKRTVDSMIAAGIKANGCGIPVVLDPVGAGASAFRNEAVKLLLKQVKFSVIRGNLSEIRYLLEGSGNTKGVDASVDDMSQSSTLIAKRSAKRFDCVVAITGKTDTISDGQRVLCIDNGHEELANITGTGCMCTALIGAFCGAASDMLSSAVAGIACMGIAGEIAYGLSSNQGLGSFRTSIMDVISRLREQTFIERARIYEAND